MSTEEKALQIATAAHKGQTRWDKSVKYITHPIAVAELVRHLGVKYVIVALLHDVVEDTSVTLADLAKVFSQEIVDAVDAMTKREGESYLTYLLRLMENVIALAVKIADITHNMSCGMKKKSSAYNKYEVARFLLENSEQIKSYKIPE